MGSTKAIRVAILCGGSSHERAVSLRSGARVEQALRDNPSWDATLIDVTSNIEDQLSAESFDVAFIALHGRGGEDDVIQSICERVGLCYTGTPAGSCFKAFNKGSAKRLLQDLGIPTPPFIVLDEQAIDQLGIDGIQSEAVRLDLPLMVKPAQGGSALGTRYVDDSSQLARAILGALNYDQQVVLERHIAGSEISVAILGESDGTKTLPAVEIVPRLSDWFDYESRYTHGATEFRIPPDVPESVLTQAESVALAAYGALNIQGYGRVDLIVDSEGSSWVLEVSPGPGLTDISTFSVALSAAKITFSNFVCSLLLNALHKPPATPKALD